MKTAVFVPSSSTGKDSFRSTYPTRTFILEGDKLRQVVAVLQAPALKGIHSPIPSNNSRRHAGEGADVSIFIAYRHSADALLLWWRRAARLPPNVLALAKKFFFFFFFFRRGPQTHLNRPLFFKERNAMGW